MTHRSSYSSDQETTPEGEEQGRTKADRVDRDSTFELILSLCLQALSNPKSNGLSVYISVSEQQAEHLDQAFMAKLTEATLAARHRISQIQFARPVYDERLCHIYFRPLSQLNNDDQEPDNLQDVWKGLYRRLFD